MLGTSTRPGFGSRDSGISAGPSSSSGRMIGTATSRTAPHQKCSTSQPPTIGPRAAPPEKPAAQIATASLRRLGCGKMFRISDSVDGMSMAPNRPSPARPAISHSALGANAVTADTAAKPALPTNSSRRRPILSPREPIATRSPARTRG